LVGLQQNFAAGTIQQSVLEFHKNQAIFPRTFTFYLIEQMQAAHVIIQ